MIGSLASWLEKSPPGNVEKCSFRKQEKSPLGNVEKCSCLKLGGFVLSRHVSLEVWRLIGSSVGWLVGWLAGWLADRLAVWMAG